MGFADSGLFHELDADPSHVGSGTHIGRFNRRRARRLVLQASCECTACGDPQRGLSAVQRQQVLIYCSSSQRMVLPFGCPEALGR